MSKVERFQDLNCWKVARELTRMVYVLSKRPNPDRLQHEESGKKRGIVNDE